MSEKKQCINCGRNVVNSMILCPYCGKDHFIEQEFSGNSSDNSSLIDNSNNKVIEKVYIETHLDESEGNDKFQNNVLGKQGNQIKLNINGYSLEDIVKIEPNKKVIFVGKIVVASVAAFIFLICFAFNFFRIANSRDISKKKSTIVQNMNQNPANVNSEDDKSITGYQTDDGNNENVPINNTEYTKGVVLDTEYNNTWLGVKYPIPEGYYNADNKYYEAYTNENTDCGAFFVNKEGDKILISIRKNIPETMTEEDYLDKITVNLYNRKDYEYKCLLSPISIEAEKKFYGRDFSAVKGNIRLSQSYFVIKKDDKIVSFIFTTKTNAFLKNEAMFSKLQKLEK